MTAADRQGIQSRTSLAPVALDWTDERGERGGGVSGGARCTARGCAVRYTAGSDRPCPEHRPPDDGRGYRWPDDGYGYRWNGDPSTEDDDDGAERLEKRRSPAAERQNARERAERSAAAGLRQIAAERAAVWLAAYLAGRGGRANYHVIIAAAADAGHSSAACRSARRMLALTSARTSRANGEPFRTDWVLPDVSVAERAAADQDAQQRAERAAELLRARVERRTAIEQRCADAAAERRDARLTGPMPAITG